MKKRKVSLPVQIRGPASGDGVCVRAATANEVERTVDIVWSTGAPVRRHGVLPDGSGYGSYVEELSLEPAAVDLTRLNSGAPLLDSHFRWSLAGQIGVVVEGSAGVKNGAGAATVRFSEREEVEPIFRDVVGGIVRNISVGYSVQAYEVTREDGQVPVFRAVKWTPMEVSAVPVGADSSAGFRAADDENPCTILIRKKGETGMAGKAKNVAGETAEVRTEPAAQPVPEETRMEPAVTAAAETVDADAIRREATEVERTRVAEITTAVGKAALGDEVAADLVGRGVTIDVARAEIIDKLAMAAEGTETRGTRIEVGASGDDPAVLSERMAEAVACRYTGQEPSEAAREFVGLSVVGVAAELLEARGQSTRRLRPAAVIERAMGISDFLILLQGVGNRILMPAYEATPTTYRSIARRMTNADFREKALIRDGDFPELLPLNEHGELKQGALSESKETVKLVTVGRRLRLTRNALINDDLGAFADMANKAGQAAARFENKTVWNVVINNTKLSSDSKALFHADHKNLAGAGGAIAAATVGAGKTAIRVQTNQDGNTLNYQPAIIAVPAALETVLEQFLALVVVPTEEGKVVPASHKRLEPVIEPLLDAHSATAWYLFTNPALLASIVHVYLEGFEGPQIAQRDATDMLGMEYDVVLDFTAAPVDFRGGYKNPGA